jgi:hypothetical protein
MVEYVEEVVIGDEVDPIAIVPWLWVTVLVVHAGPVVPLTAST